MPKDNEFLDQYVEDVIAKIERNDPNISLISLDNQIINEDQVKRLADAIKNSSNVSQIMLRTNLPLNCLVMLRDAIKENKCIKSVALLDNTNLDGYSELKTEIENIVRSNLRGTPRAIR